MQPLKACSFVNLSGYELFERHRFPSLGTYAPGNKDNSLER